MRCVCLIEIFLFDLTHTIYWNHETSSIHDCHAGDLIKCFCAAWSKCMGFHRIINGRTSRNYFHGERIIITI